MLQTISVLIPVLRVLVIAALAAEIIIIISVPIYITFTTVKAVDTLFGMMKDLVAASVEDLVAASVEDLVAAMMATTLKFWTLID
jgi:hypothetical protein